MAQNISYISRFNQRKDYTALRFGNITPCDIDAFLDFGNKVFVIIEFKLINKELSWGQKTAIERLVDTLAISKPTIGIIAEHNQPPSEEIDTANSKVILIRHNYKWIEYPKKQFILKYIIDYFLKKNELEYQNPPEILDETLSNEELDNIALEIDKRVTGTGLPTS